MAQGGEVGDQAFAVDGIEGQRPVRPQLAPVAGMGLPLTADFSPVSSPQVRDRADQPKLIPRFLVLHLHHGVAEVLSPEGDAQHLDGP